jgi:DNA-binding MarR family transcriptional regulator
MLAPDRNALYELDILRAVEQDCRLTNRSVARQLGVSLKLAHQLLARMVEKGLLHVRVVHARRWDYFLTPQGLAEKTRLTLEFLEFSMRFYREARRRSADLCLSLRRHGVRTVAFLGAGDLAEIAYLGVRESELSLTEVYDDTASRGRFMAVPVRPLQSVAQTRADAVVVCCYDARAPMREGFLPPGVPRHPRMHWIFGPASGEPWAEMHAEELA